MIVFDMKAVGADAMPVDMEHMHERLEWARENRGYDSSMGAAHAIGVKPSTYRAHENGQNKFKEDAAKHYGRAFQVSWMWLLHGIGRPEPTPEELALYATMPEVKAPEQPAPNAQIGDKVASSGKLIPVYGSAVGGVDGEFDMNGSRIDELLAPPVISDVNGAYAVMVSGDSMEPAFFDGFTCFVDPKRRCSRGDFVIAQIQLEEEGPRLAYVKRLVRWNSQELVLEQYNPAKELRFPHDNVVSVHYIALAGRI